MAKEKRTKPCSNCKKSKVKCIYNDSLPCERCIKTGQSHGCQFIAKLPSLKLPLLNSHNSASSHPLEPPNDATFPRITPLQQSVQPPASQLNPQPVHHPLMLFLQPLLRISEFDWKNQMEGKMNNFDNKLNDLIDILKSNQAVLYENQQRFTLMQQQQQQLLNFQQQQQQQQYHQHPQGQPFASRYLGPNSYPASRSYSPVDSPTNGLGHRPQPALAYQTTKQQLLYFPDAALYPTQHSPVKDASTSSLEEKHSANGVKRSIEDTSSDESDVKIKRIKSANDSEFPEDFRDGFLSKEQAEELFSFFDANISQQLFGFEISRFSVEEIWTSSPILICAICTISSMHHPKEELSSKSRQLAVYLHSLCGDVLYKGKPKNDVEGFNTIVALVLCSFWLSDSQMFTGLALQLAKEIGLSTPRKKGSSGLSDKDRLKLWYLLYVLDGQQSLTFNRLPLINANDYSLSHSREMLLSDSTNTIQYVKSKQIEEADRTKEQHEEKQPSVSSNAALVNAYPETISNEMVLAQEKHERFTDMRLVSQVEYNQALNEAFRGNAWELLAPSAFGIPSKSNLELDKWMVSWTVLLSPGNYGAVWSSKSTLIYYNFAKMHINSSGVRQLRICDDRSPFPKWEQYVSVPSTQENETEANGDESGSKSGDSSSLRNNNNSNNDEEEDEEFISNRELICEDETIVSANIAVNAAQTVLNLVLNDSDILNNLKYVPVHIHIMLYYAALLLLNPPHISNDKSRKFDPLEYYKRLIENLKIIRALQYKINLNLPTDKKFGARLMSSLEEIVSEKAVQITGEIKDPATKIPEEAVAGLLAQLELLRSKSSNVEIFEDSSSRGSSPGPEKISAWPGSNHGHP